MQRSFDIIAETDDFVVVNKPSGLLSIPDREGDEVSLKKLLREQYGEIFTVHRIDKDTSGLILFARNETAHKFFSQAFEERSVEKYYLGIVMGTLAERSGTIDAPIAQHSLRRSTMIVHKRGKAAVTDYEVVEEFRKFSLLKMRIHTGRTHQIRVHLRYIGHPIVCDPLYGDGAPVMLSAIKKNYRLSRGELEERPLLSRLGLHAERLVFVDATNRRFDCAAPLPKDMSALVQQLAKNGK